MGDRLNVSLQRLLSGLSSHSPSSKYALEESHDSITALHSELDRLVRFHEKWCFCLENQTIPILGIDVPLVPYPTYCKLPEILLSVCELHPIFFSLSFGWCINPCDCTLLLALHISFRRDWLPPQPTTIRTTRFLAARPAAYNWSRKSLWKVVVSRKESELFALQLLTSRC